MRRIPNFVLVRAFEAAARLESFSRAAAELHLTPSAISHQIQELEAFLGHKLFDRARRRVFLTPIGRRLYGSFAQALDTLEMACREVMQAPEDRVLKVHCSPSFAVKWLGPRLRRFIDGHPEVSLQLLSAPGTLDLREHPQIDVMISYGTTVDAPGVDVIGLGSERIAPLFAPAMRQRYADDATLLSQATLIESQLCPVSWRDWFAANAAECPTPDRLSFDRATLSIAAAVDEVGIALESVRLAEREIARAELIVGDFDSAPILRTLHFLSTRTNERHTPKIAAFHSWLLTELGLQ